jgi:hypothetical protein
VAARESCLEDLREARVGGVLVTARLAAGKVTVECSSGGGL